MVEHETQVVKALRLRWSSTIWSRRSDSGLPLCFLRSEFGNRPKNMSHHDFRPHRETRATRFQNQLPHVDARELRSVGPENDGSQRS